ncbi:MAG: hypothetical protein FJW27_19640 [Acidimicrobiia bacterium]|nr:hypothetical protein [Acidimicrobiia bacterium]
MVIRVILIAAVLLIGGQARAQTLTIQGDHFAIDGTPRFLTFISYFSGMSAPHVIQDLHLLHRLGFDGVRVWPNLDTGPQLMNADGSLRPDSLARLLFILDQAHQEHLVVDITFTREHIRGMTAAALRAGITATASALRTYGNVLFDIQNERNVTDGRFLSEDDVARTLHAVKAVDPARIVTASESRGEDDGGSLTSGFVARTGLDVTAFHERRGPDWYQASFIEPLVRALKTSGRPVYLQEPNRRGYAGGAANDRAEYFLQAVTNAKQAGAAAWCFHSDVAFDFRSGSEFLEDRLRAFPDVEWAFVTSLVPRIVLLTSNGVNVLSASGGGGGSVGAGSTVNSPGTWSELRVISLSGGPLVSGDRIALETVSGRHYLQADGGGGSSLRATALAVGGWEAFVVERIGDGAIRSGDAIAFRTLDRAAYIVAEGGGGREASARAFARGEWETFTILFVN